MELIAILFLFGGLLLAFLFGVAYGKYVEKLKADRQIDTLAETIDRLVSGGATVG